MKEDRAPSAILELVDGPKDMRFAMTAAALARQRETDEGVRDLTLRNVKKVTRYRKGGEEELEQMVESLRKVGFGKEKEDDE
jgi:large subunit ribosomal protein L17